jgi:hypothetical protein
MHSPADPIFRLFGPFQTPIALEQREKGIARINKVNRVPEEQMVVSRPFVAVTTRGQLVLHGGRRPQPPAPSRPPPSELRILSKTIPHASPAMILADGDRPGFLETAPATTRRWAKAKTLRAILASGIAFPHLHS